MKPVTSVILKNDRRRKQSEQNTLTAKIFAKLSFLIVFCSLSGVMIWASIYITNRFQMLERPYEFIEIMLYGNFGILFFESIFQVLSSLYFSKDMRILLRMPIASKEIIHAKLLKMIMAEYEMEIIMLAIPMAVYGIKNFVDIGFYLYIPVILIVLPIIPICITAILVAVLMRITNQMKNKTVVMYITILVSSLVLGLITSKLKLVKPIMNSLLNYENIIGIKNVLFYFAISIFSYIFTINIISPIFLEGAIGATINGGKEKVKEKVELTINDFKEQNYQKAYLRKEFLLIKRSPIFFIQCIILPLYFSAMILALVIMLFIASQTVGREIIDGLSDLVSEPFIGGVFLSMVQIIYMMNFASVIAVSKEERWSILSKYLPIKLSRQINMKIRIGKIVNFISSISAIVLYMMLTRNLINTVLFLFISFGMNVFGEKIKILIDLKNPKIDWDNEFTMMKQNTNVMYELFYTMIVDGIILLLGLLIKNTTIYFIILGAIELIINLIISNYIFENDKKIFEKLY